MEARGGYDANYKSEKSCCSPALICCLCILFLLLILVAFLYGLGVFGGPIPPTNNKVAATTPTTTTSTTATTATTAPATTTGIFIVSQLPLQLPLQQLQQLLLLQLPLQLLQ